MTEKRRVGTLAGASATGAGRRGLWQIFGPHGHHHQGPGGRMNTENVGGEGGEAVSLRPPPMNFSADQQNRACVFRGEYKIPFLCSPSSLSSPAQ